VAFGGAERMPTNPSKIYKQHVANLRELEAALGNVARLARAAIAQADPQRALRSLLRLFAFLLGAWAECRLKKLLHEEHGFNDAERTIILAKGTQLEQWQECVDLAFRKHFNLPKAELSARTLGVAPSARRESLRQVLSADLRIIIEIRNKLAHGQWIYPFNSEGTAVEQDKYKLINKENLLSLEFKYAMLGHLADAMHDLVVSPTTFERDFDGHFKKLFQVQTNLQRRDYAKYEQALVNSRKQARARAARATNKSVDADAQERPCALGTRLVCAGQLRRYSAA
jgi:hypothetical protein